MVTAATVVVDPVYECRGADGDGSSKCRSGSHIG
jgi:hypothetical protein